MLLGNLRGKDRCDLDLCGAHSCSSVIPILRCSKVQVQRPGVAQAISLDVYILRWAAAVLRKARKLNTDLPALVDEWASSLFRCVVWMCVSH